jgi:predicted phosphodiesterase
MKKILVSSDCNGNFELLFSKVTQLSQKTKFDLMFLVGNVCTIEAAK